MLELDGQNVLVLGAGISGRSAAAFCARQGAHVVLADERPDVEAKGLRNGVIYYDGQFDDARLAVSLAQTVADRGGGWGLKLIAGLVDSVDVDRHDHGTEVRMRRASRIGDAE